MNKIRLIIWREYITRVRKPSFLVMTVLGPLLLMGGLFLAGTIALQESGKHSALVVDGSGLLIGKLKDSDKVQFSYSAVMVPDSVFAKGPHTLKVYVPANVTYAPKAEITYKQSPSQMVQDQIVSQIEKLVEAAKLERDSIDPAKYEGIKTDLKVKLYDIKDNGQESHDQVKALIGFGFGYLIFFFILLYGLQVMRGVMEEKQSRVVEVLISSVKPFQLMMGKIVGIAMVGLTQFLLWVLLSTVLGSITLGLAKDRFSQMAGAGGGAMMTTQIQQEAGAAAGMNEEDQAKLDMMKEAFAIWEEIPVTAVLLLFVFYFLGGYLLFSSLYAAVGSAVDSEADSQQFMMPVMAPMFLGIFVAQMAVVNPDGPAVFWCSIIPFTSPVVMMIRVAMGDAFEHPWHLVLSMGLLIATFVFTTWLAGRIYRTGILLYGKKITWKELGKWLFYRG